MLSDVRHGCAICSDRGPPITEPISTIAGSNPTKRERSATPTDTGHQNTIKPRALGWPSPQELDHPASHNFSEESPHLSSFQMTLEII